MTNREKFKEVFGREANMNECPIYCHTTDGNKCPCYKNKCYSGKWWNAEYKEPTTKNEVKYCDRNICLKNEYNNIGCEDCEVTKSQEPTTKNDLGVDAVSRQEVLDLIADYDLSMGQVVRGIHALPPVTPQEPKTGHWIGKGDFITCSCCNEMSYPFDSAGYGSIYHDYCPNCGAKMAESEET